MLTNIRSFSVVTLHMSVPPESIMERLSTYGTNFCSVSFHVKTVLIERAYDGDTALLTKVALAGRIMVWEESGRKI